MTCNLIFMRSGRMERMVTETPSPSRRSSRWSVRPERLGASSTKQP